MSVVIDGKGSEFAAAHEAGRELGALQHTVLRSREDGIPFIVLPNGAVQSLEQYDRPAPPHYARKGSVSFADAPSFCVYVQGYQGEAFEIFADPQGSSLTAILDYHEGGIDGKRGYCQHTAELALRFDPAWSAWLAMHGKLLSQVQFAEFIEEHLKEIAQPDGARLLEVTSDLQIHRDVSFASKVNLVSGAVQLRYQEEDRKDEGTVTVPNALFLALPVYEYGSAFGLEARLRHRIKEQKLYFEVRLCRPDLVIRAAFAAVLAEVQQGAGQKPLLGGAG